MRVTTAPSGRLPRNSGNRRRHFHGDLAPRCPMKIRHPHLPGSQGHSRQGQNVGFGVLRFAAARDANAAVPVYHRNGGIIEASQPGLQFGFHAAGPPQQRVAGNEQRLVDAFPAPGRELADFQVRHRRQLAADAALDGPALRQVVTVRTPDHSRGEERRQGNSRNETATIRFHELIGASHLWTLSVKIANRPPAQCRILFPASEIPRNSWGGPPGPRGTPSSRIRNDDTSLLQGMSRPTGASAADQGVRPTICADVRQGENYVALAHQPAPQPRRCGTENQTDPASDFVRTHKSRQSLLKQNTLRFDFCANAQNPPIPRL